MLGVLAGQWAPKAFMVTFKPNSNEVREGSLTFYYVLLHSCTFYLLHYRGAGRDGRRELQAGRTRTTAGQRQC